jgi:hypothetical protein
MALSPNYGWAEPDNSSLVKNGAQDIRALGDAIDTSVWNVGYGQAGKNKIINGDFAINQRNFTSVTANAVYGFDRWRPSIAGSTGTTTITPQTFTAGSAPVAGYEARNFVQIVTAGQSASDSLSVLRQLIEDVRTFAGQTITISYWARATSGTPFIISYINQNFGSGGSPSAEVFTSTTRQTISTTWTRYSFTITVPSIAGKTIGTDANTSALVINIGVSIGSDYSALVGTLGVQNNTFQIWGVQAEYGSKATPFQTASGGNPQAELAMCQRYYWRYVSTGVVRMSLGYATSADAAVSTIPYPVQMRTAPTALEQSGTATDYNIHTAAGAQVCSAVPTFLTATNNAGTVTLTATGLLTAGQGLGVRSVNTNAFFGWSAEL